jgi:thioredoxin 1
MSEEKSSIEEARLVDASNFDLLLKEERPVFVDFFATWCGPCQLMLPVIDEIAKEEGEKSFVVAKLDIDSAPEVAGKHNVMSVPTFIVFKDGKEVDRLMGAISKDAILDKIKSHL